MTDHDTVPPSAPGREGGGEGLGLQGERERITPYQLGRWIILLFVNLYCLWVVIDVIKE